MVPIVSRVSELTAEPILVEYINFQQTLHINNYIFFKSIIFQTTSNIPTTDKSIHHVRHLRIGEDTTIDHRRKVILEG